MPDNNKQHPYQALRFWEKRDNIPEHIEKNKWRQFLLDRNYNRPSVPPDRLISGFLYILDNTSKKILFHDILLLIHIERYEFFTIRHLKEMHFYKSPSSPPVADRRHFWEKLAKLQKSGFIWQPIRNWDLDDEEFKQRFGNHRNRHNYSRRYAITTAGRLLLDKFYESCGM
jgi:hypothetical protein